MRIQQTTQTFRSAYIVAIASLKSGFLKTEPFPRVGHSYTVGHLMSMRGSTLTPWSAAL